MYLPPIVNKYLTRNKQFEREIALLNQKLYNNIIVIPAINESNHIPLLFESLEINNKKYIDDSLFIVVVNNTLDDSEAIKEDNKKLLKFIEQYISHPANNLNVGYIDASTNEQALDKKNSGVGYARKLGMDNALKLFDYRNNKKKIIISLDADCIVSPNYLETIVNRYNSENLNSAVIGYEHILPEDENYKTAIINYELFLRYYVLGLRYSKSHYGFHTIGSTISCDHVSYIKSGGMNKNKAGEDFYFLEKLAKIGDIHQIKDVLVYPSARASKRVPFGTGPRINRFLQNKTDEYKLYNPDSFDILKRWNEIITIEENLLNPDKIVDKVKNYNLGLHEFIIEHNFYNIWKKVLENSRSTKQLNRQIINWMDGFRTMKLIHFLRDRHYPDINMFTALNILLEKMGVDQNFSTDEKIPALEIQEDYLRLYRKL